MIYLKFARLFKCFFLRLMGLDDICDLIVCAKKFKTKQKKKKQWVIKKKCSHKSISENDNIFISSILRIL